MKRLLAVLLLTTATPLCAAERLEGNWTIVATCGDGHEAEGRFDLQRTDEPAVFDGRLDHFDEFERDYARARVYGGGDNLIVLEFFRRVDRSGARCSGADCMYADMIAMELTRKDESELTDTYNRWRWFNTVTCTVRVSRS